MYREKLLITSNDVDDHLNLKVSSIFKFMQMVSTNHSEKIHVGQKDTIDVGMCWVITRMQVVIRRTSLWIEKLFVGTLFSQ